MLFGHLKASLSDEVFVHGGQSTLEDVLPFLHELFAGITNQLVSDLFRKSHYVVERDVLAIFDDFKLILVEDVVQALMLTRDSCHAFLAQYLQDARCCKPQRDRSTLLHEECAIVDDTTLEKSLDDKFLAFKLSVHLDHAALQEVKLIGVVTGALQNSALWLSTRLKKVNDVIEDRIVVFEVLEVRDLLH